MTDRQKAYLVGLLVGAIMSALACIFIHNNSVSALPLPQLQSPDSRPWPYCWTENIWIVCQDGGKCTMWGAGLRCEYSGKNWTMITWRY